MAAATPALLAAAVKGQESGRALIGALTAAMKEPVLTWRWEPDPTRRGHLRLAEVQVNVTTGLVIGAGVLFAAYEAAAWIAQALSGWNGGTVLTNPLKGYYEFSQANEIYQVELLQLQALQKTYDLAYQGALALWNEGKVHYDRSQQDECRAEQAALDAAYTIMHKLWVADGRLGPEPQRTVCSVTGGPYSVPPPSREVAPAPTAPKPPAPATVMEMIQFRTIGLLDPLLARGATVTQKIAP